MADFAFATDLVLHGNDLHDVGSVELAEVHLASGQVTIGVTTPVLFNSFPAADYRCAEYLLQFSQVSNFYQTKLLVIHDGVDVGVSEYAQVGIGAEIPFTVEGSFSLGMLELTLLCPTANVNPVVVKYSRVLFEV